MAREDPPPDFPPNDSEVEFDGRGTEADLTPLGRRMLGLDPIQPTQRSTPGGGCADDETTGEQHCLTRLAGAADVDSAAAAAERVLVADCNRILGFAGSTDPKS